MSAQFSSLDTVERSLSACMVACPPQRSCLSKFDLYETNSKNRVRSLLPSFFVCNSPTCTARFLPRHQIGQRRRSFPPLPCLLLPAHPDLDCRNPLWAIWLRYLAGTFKLAFNGESGIWDLGTVSTEFVLRIWNSKSWSERWVTKGITYRAVSVPYRF